jgi:hypothetical protein
VELSTDQKGAIAESAIIHAAIKLGIGVLKPLTDGHRYDLIFDIAERLVRVQCKFVRLNDGVVMSAPSQIDALRAVSYVDRTSATRSMRSPPTVPNWTSVTSSRASGSTVTSSCRFESLRAGTTRPGG